MPTRDRDGAKCGGILLVDDDPSMIQLAARFLDGIAPLRFATNGATALRLARERPPELVLLDAEMPGMSGHEVCRAIKGDPQLADVPVIFVTSHSGTTLEVAGFANGAADFIAKPISEPLLVARVKTQLKVKRLTDELRRMASTDGLTQLASRRAFDEALSREWLRGLRDGGTLSVLLLDVDHFKLYNDRYGHPAGDACLRSVADALSGCALRPADVAARYGGEEFALLLPQTPSIGAQHVAARALAAVAALSIPHADSPTAPHVTVSVGVSSLDVSRSWAHTGARGRTSIDPSLSPTSLLSGADRALYAAKAAGRARAFGVNLLSSLIGDPAQAGPYPLLTPNAEEALA